jgi:hypothetical protein
MNNSKEEGVSPSLSDHDKGGVVRTDSQVSIVRVGRENLADSLPPHESYEGRHRFDPSATWTPEEEAKVLRKTDLYLLSWLCVMVSTQFQAD